MSLSKSLFLAAGLFAASASAAIDVSVNLPLLGVDVVPIADKACGAPVTFSTTIMNLGAYKTIAGLLQLADTAGNVLCKATDLSATVAVDLSKFTLPMKKTLLTNLLAKTDLTGDVLVSVTALKAANAKLAVALSVDDLLASVDATIKPLVDDVFAKYSVSAGVMVPCTTVNMLSGDYTLAIPSLLNAKVDGLDISDIASLVLSVPDLKMAALSITGLCPCTAFTLNPFKDPLFSLIADPKEILFPKCAAPTITASIGCTGPMPPTVTADVYVYGGDLLKKFFHDHDGKAELLKKVIEGTAMTLAEDKKKVVKDLDELLKDATKIATDLAFTLSDKGVPELKKLLPPTNLHHGDYTIIIRSKDSANVYPVMFSTANFSLNALCLSGMLG